MKSYVNFRESYISPNVDLLDASCCRILCVSSLGTPKITSTSNAFDELGD